MHWDVAATTLSCKYTKLHVYVICLCAWQVDVSCVAGCVCARNLYVICPLWISVNYIFASMLTKFETKSARVKGLSFHPKRPWVLSRYEFILSFVGTSINLKSVICLLHCIINHNTSPVTYYG